MKKLILLLIFIPFLTSANEMKISDDQIKSSFLTVVKDTEVEGMLSKTAEFNDCRKKNEFDPKDGQAEKNKKLKDATDCFKNKIGGAKGDALKKMADDLQLENYGLIKSKNIADITKYLSDKMTKSLTGRDPNEKDPKKILESMQWKNYKAVDQKVFIDLYTNQLMKNALFEVSRFCFENLRVDGVKSEDFATHWVKMPMDPNDPKIPDIFKINDRGDPPFFKMTTNDITKKDEIYKDVVKGLGPNIDPAIYKNFFPYCQKALNLLCTDFKKNISSQTRKNNEEQSVSLKTVKDESNLSKGANACLTMDRLTVIRTNMSNTARVAQQFDEMKEGKEAFALQMITNPKIYQRGKGEGEESLDELTSYSSEDILGKDQDDKLEKLEKKCAGGQGGAECDQFLVENDSLDKAIHNVESEMNLKRELEIARVLELKKANKPDELTKYLEDNGHFDLLEKVKNPPQNWKIEDDIANIYDARKVAEIENLKLKVGKRQVSEDNKLSDQDKDKMKNINITDTKEEKARLAQVMMFNNIITSQLTLVDGSGKEVGRNVSGWNKELKGIEDKANKIDKELFSGIQQDAEKNTSNMDDISIAGGGIIDMILGKEQ